MIVAIVMAFIFLMLVFTVSVLSTSAHKRAHSRRDRAIALNLAEAGIADALYRMNYRNYGAGLDYQYPWKGNNPLTVNDPFGAGSGSYTIKLTDNAANEDILEMTGVYKGEVKAVQVKIRGHNTIGDDLNKDVNGIAEAFNKHVIYADTISSPATATPDISGNLCGVNISLALGASGQYTATKISSCLPPAALGFPVDSASDPGDPPSWTTRCRDTDGTNGATYDRDPAYDPLPGGVTILDDTYTIDGAAIAGETWFFDTGDGGKGDVVIQGTTTMGATGFVKAARDMTIDINNVGLNLQGDRAEGVVKAVRDMTITLGVANPNPIGANAHTGVALYAGGDIITIPSGVTINGDVLAVGTITLRGPKVKGSILSASNISLLTAASAIYGSSSDKTAAITTNSSSSVTITIGAAPKIYLDDGTNNKAAIVAQSSGAGNSATVTINNDIVTDGSSNAVIIAYTSDVGGGNATITVGNNVDIDGLLYANSSNSGATCNITIDNTGATEGVKGTIVAQDEVRLEDGAKVSWDSSLYKSSTYPLYGAFTGGRRVYLPVIGSWKEIK